MLRIRGPTVLLGDGLRATMVRRLALLYLATASPLMLLCFVLPGHGAEWVFTILTMGFPTALIALAVGGRGRLAALGWSLAVLLVILEGCAVLMMLLRGRVVDGSWVGGLPAAAAVQLYGLFAAPLLVVALAYALTFERYHLRDEDLARLDSMRRDADGEG